MRTTLHDSVEARGFRRFPACAERFKRQQAMRGAYESAFSGLVVSCVRVGILRARSQDQALRGALDVTTTMGPSTCEVAIGISPDGGGTIACDLPNSKEDMRL